jgi:hypothetical protein
LADVGVEGVELVGEFAPDGFGGAEQRVQMRIALPGYDAFGPEEEDKAFEQRGLAGQPGGLETFVGILRRAFVIQARFPHGGDDDPVAGQIDGVAVCLVHGGHAPSGKRVVQRVAGALAFEDRDELLLALLEAAQHGIGDLAVHLDVTFAGEGEGVSGGGGAGVAEQAAEDVGQEVRQQGGFLEFIGAAGSDEPAPVLEFGLPLRHALRQVEGPHPLADDFRVEERFGFERHLFSGRLGRDGEKPSAFLPARCGMQQAESQGKGRAKARAGKCRNDGERPGPANWRHPKAARSHFKATPKPFASLTS